MTVRSSILSHIAGIVGGIDGMQGVSVGRYPDNNLDGETLPAAFVFAMEDEVAEVVVGFEGFWLQVCVGVKCQPGDIEALIGVIHAAVLADVTCGGKAVNTLRSTCSPSFVDPAHGFSGFDLIFRVLYRHPFGAP